MLVVLDLVEDHAAEHVLRAVELKRVSVRHRGESGVTPPWGAELSGGRSELGVIRVSIVWPAQGPLFYRFEINQFVIPTQGGFYLLPTLREHVPIC